MIRLVCLILAIGAASKFPNALEALTNHLGRSMVAQYERAAAMTSMAPQQLAQDCTPRPNNGSEQMRAYLAGVELCQ